MGASTQTAEGDVQAANAVPNPKVSGGWYHFFFKSPPILEDSRKSWLSFRGAGHPLYPQYSGDYVFELERKYELEKARDDD